MTATTTSPTRDAIAVTTEHDTAGTPNFIGLTAARHIPEIQIQKGDELGSAFLRVDGNWTVFPAEGKTPAFAADATEARQRLERGADDFLTDLLADIAEQA
jgi:hypothetical protein